MALGLKHLVSTSTLMSISMEDGQLISSMSTVTGRENIRFISVIKDREARGCYQKVRESER